MLVTNAIKKLSKYGAVEDSSSLVWLEKDGQVVEVRRNGGDLSDMVASIKVRGSNDHSDSMIDYSSGVFCDNISQAIRIAGW